MKQATALKPTPHVKDASAMTIRTENCPACGYNVAVPFFDGGKQPLATIAWPANVKEAQTMKHLPLDFVRCVDCGHISNAAFDYDDVPYSDKPNLMFNKGAIWAGFIKDLQEKMAQLLPQGATVIEVGHGDGSFIGSLAALRPDCRFIGFDPHGATNGSGKVELKAELFIPNQHLPELKPHLIIMRHVLEHLKSSLGFLQEITFAAAVHNQSPLGYFEVPCVDRVLETGRTVDLYYEHNSQFTTGSFSSMLSKCGSVVESIGHGYDGEVIYGFVRLAGKQEHVGKAMEAMHYLEGTREALNNVRKQLDEMISAKKSVAIWGGTGKSAAFMNFYGADAKRFPLVVDSDPAKVGTYVPGTGQEIRFRDWLKDHPAEVIIVPPQWRAADIVREMEREGIKAATILIEHDHRLIDFHKDKHPYHK